MLGCLVQAFKQYIKFLLQGVDQCGFEVQNNKDFNLVLGLKISGLSKRIQKEDHKFVGIEIKPGFTYTVPVKYTNSMICICQDGRIIGICHASEISKFIVGKGCFSKISRFSPAA